MSAPQLGASRCGSTTAAAVAPASPCPDPLNDYVSCVYAGANSSDLDGQGLWPLAAQ